MAVLLLVACGSKGTTAPSAVASSAASSAPPSTASSVATASTSQGPAAPVGTASNVAVGADPDGRLEVFYVDRAGALLHKSQTSPTVDCALAIGTNWANATSVSPKPVSGVAMGTHGDGRLEVFFIGAGDEMHHAWQSEKGGAFGAPTKFVGTAKNMAVARRHDGGLDVFSVGLDDVVHHAWQPTPATWQTEALTGPSGPKVGASAEIAAESFKDGTVGVFFIDAGGNIVQIAEKPSFDGWQAPTRSGAAATHIAVSHNADGRLEILYANASDGDVLSHGTESATKPGAWDWGGKLGAEATSIAATTNKDGRVEALFVNLKGNLRHVAEVAPNGAWSEPAAFGLETKHASAAVDAAGCLEAFYVKDGALYHQHQLAAGWWWSGEYPLPDASPKAPFSVGPWSLILPTVDDLPPATAKWSVNDHTIVQASDGWHFFGIVAHDEGVKARGGWMGAALGAPGPLIGATPTLHYKQLDDCGDPEFKLPAAFKCVEGGLLWAPHIVLAPGEKGKPGLYHMIYAAGSLKNDETAWRISLRTSTDMLKWSPATVLFEDGFQARDPMLLDGGNGQWILYYDATDPKNGGAHVVAYRTSTHIDDPAEWTKSARGIAYSDVHEGTDYGPTESPFVVHRGPYYYLFIGPRPYGDPVTDPKHPRPDTLSDKKNWEIPDYVGTDVFRSTDWRKWTNADFVGNIPAHALEVIHDEERDKWYVSERRQQARWREGSRSSPGTTTASDGSRARRRCAVGEARRPNQGRPHAPFAPRTAHYAARKLRDASWAGGTWPRGAWLLRQRRMTKTMASRASGSATGLRFTPPTAGTYLVKGEGGVVLAKLSAE